MEVLFARGGFQWKAHIMENTNEGQFVALKIASRQLQNMAISLFCRLPYFEENPKISNSQVAEAMNFYTRAVWTSKDGVVGTIKNFTFRFESVEDVCTSMTLDGFLVDNCQLLRAIEEIERRVKESNEIFEKKEGKELDLNKYEVFIFKSGEGWIKCKGEKVKATNFGVWVEKETESELVSYTSCVDMLID